MSRSGYSDDCEYIGLYRANVDRSLRSRRGQAFLRELASALDAMPVKELIVNELRSHDGYVCALGAVAESRGLDAFDIDSHDGDVVSRAFGIARIMALEIAYQNDEAGWKETPAERWTRMRAWADANISKEPA